MSGLRRRIEDERDDIHFPERFDRGINHPHVEPVQRAMNPGGIHEDDLTAVQILHRNDPVPGGLRLVGDDRDFGAHDPVEQGGLAGVRATDQRSESGARHAVILARAPERGRLVDTGAEHRYSPPNVRVCRISLVWTGVQPRRARSCRYRALKLHDSRDKQTQPARSSGGLFLLGRTIVRIAFQGEPGAYSEAAALRFSPGAEVLPCRSFEDVFAAVSQGRVSRGILPMENSIGGSIHRNYDLLVENELPIVGEVELAVDHCLLARPGTDLGDVKVVYSHPQALAQCEEYLRRMQGVEVIAVY